MWILIFTKIDLIHCRGHLPSISGLLAKFFFKKKFIFDCRGLWADERLDNNSWNLRNPLHYLTYLFFKNFEKLFFKYSDHIIVLTLKIKKILLNKTYLNNLKISSIPCSANFNKFRIFNKSTILARKKELKIQNHEFIIGYFGSISNIYHPNEMIKFFLYCKSFHSKLIILFFSDDFDYLKKNTSLFKKLKTNDYKLISLKSDELPVNYNICDLTLSF